MRRTCHAEGASENPVDEESGFEGGRVIDGSFETAMSVRWDE